jgi:uncharacterized protein YuzB (UPF0349 family)
MKTYEVSIMRLQCLSFCHSCELDKTTSVELDVASLENGFFPLSAM